MSFFDNLFGSSDSTVTQETKLPKWVNTAGQNNYKLAQTIAARPYMSNPYQRIAGMTSDQTDAQEMLRSWKPKELTAEGADGLKLPRMIDNIPGMDGGKAGSVEDYMNPFIDQVLNRTVSRIQDASAMAKQWQANMAQHAEGAFGDARHGVADANIEKDALKQVADAVASGYSSAYDSAQSMRSADIDRILQRAQFDREGQNSVLQYLDALYRSGTNTQQQQQKNLDLLNSDFEKQRDYPIDQLNLLISALSNSPYGKSSSTSTPGPSTAASILSGVGSLASLFQ